MTTVWAHQIDPNLIAKERPQVVIAEFVERDLPLWVSVFPYGREIFQKEYRVWFAINTPSQAGRNIDEESGLMGAVRVGEPDGKTGYIAFGPYTKLSAGRHQVTFRVKVNALSEDQVVTFDIAGDKGRRIFAKRDMTAAMFGIANEWQDITLDFTLDETISDMEFRIDYRGGVDLFIDYIRHKALDDEPKPVMACMNKELPWDKITSEWTKQ